MNTLTNKINTVVILKTNQQINESNKNGGNQKARETTSNK